jgi:predicted nuclease with TOPRIM domain
MVGRLESINSQLSIISEEKTKHTSKKAEAERTYAECESEIQELSKGQSFEVLNKDLQLARAQFGAAGKSIDDIDKEIGRLIGVSHGLPFFADAFEDALQQLAIMRRENILPADVSEGFVNRLLDWPQTQICICGRSLDPGAHEDQRKCIEDYRNRTMAVDLNHALLSLVNSLESGTVRGFKVRADATVKGLTIAVKGREQAVISQLDSQTLVAALEEKRQKLSVEKIQQLQRSQRAANEARIDSERHLKEIEINLKRLEFEQGKLDSEINGLQKSGKGSEINKLLHSKKQAQELAGFIQEARAAVKNTFHSKLQDLVSHYYDPVAPDDSKAHVDKSTLLPAIRVDGEVRKNIGGAQRQLLVLSHIVSLAQLRKWLHDELKKVGINPGNIDEHCFVLDSVFGPVADEFREKCAEFLVGKARQVMVLVAAQQWDETVRTRLENPANKIYRLVRCTNKTDIKPEERTMKFRKKDIEVFRQVGPEVKSFTVAEEVKL